MTHSSGDDPEVGSHRPSLRRQTGFEGNGVPKGNRAYVDAKTPGKSTGFRVNSVRLHCKQHSENNAVPTRSVR